MSAGASPGYKPGNDRGFTLVEVLVALLILALAAGAAFRLISDSHAQLARSQMEQEALMLANATLAGIGHVMAVQPGHLAGTQGDLAWTVDIGNQLDDPPPAEGFSAYPVHVAITWRNDRGPQALTLESVRLGHQSIGP